MLMKGHLNHESLKCKPQSNVEIKPLLGYRMKETLPSVRTRLSRQVRLPVRVLRAP